MTLFKHGMKTKIRSLRVGLVKPVEIDNPSVPDDTTYNLYETVSASQTWTAPADGLYKIELFGRSGAGGKGETGTYTTWSNGSALELAANGYAASGGGGGGGAYCCSNRVNLKKGDTVVISIGTTCTTTINSSVESYPVMTCTSGGDGGDGSYTRATSSKQSGVITPGSGGIGGMASGGTYVNINGTAGSAGGKLNKKGDGNYLSAVSGGAGGTPGFTGGTVGGAGGTTEEVLLISDTYVNKTTYKGGSAKAGFVNMYIDASVSLFPEEPTSYNLLETVTASKTWTAPADGWYQIDVHGASGKGGNGATGKSPWNTSEYGVGGGGGGGGSGYGSSVVKLNKGDTLEIVAGSVGSSTSVKINSSHETYSTISVTSGGNGGNAAVGYAGSGGTGGTASGGDVNINGGSGGKGTYNSGKSVSDAYGGSGGNPAHSDGNTGGKGGNASKNSSYSGSAGKTGKINIFAGNTNAA